MNRLELLAKYADNTASEDKYWELGIFKFAKDFFPDLFTNDFSILHYRMAHILFSLWYPHKERRLERQSYFLVHREAAKSTTGSFLFPIYSIFMKGIAPYVRVYDFDKNRSTDEIIKCRPIGEDFIIIASETSSQAEAFVNDIRDAIDTKKEMAQLFGEKSPRFADFDDAERRGTDKWTTSAFITVDNTVVMGVGAGQRVRGRKVKGKRPSLIIVDDMYSQHNTKTEETREKLNHWFFSELVNSADSLKGKMLWLGTLVHPDTVVSKIRKSDNWYGIEQPIIGRQELSEMLNYCKMEDTFVLPSKEQAAKLQSTLTTMSWPERHTLHYILSLYKDETIKGTLNYFYQEYMNEPIAPESVMIGEDAFMLKDMKITKRNNRQEVEFHHNNAMWRGELVLDVGVDMASSLSATADDTVIYLAGWARVYPYVDGIDYMTVLKENADGWVVPVIAHVEGGRYDIHDYEGRPGVCQALERLVKKYVVNRVVIEVNGQQEIIMRDIKKYFIENHLTRTVIVPEYANTNKAERIMSVILPIVQRYGSFICNKQYGNLIMKTYYQLLTIGISDHDDYPDALEEAYKYSKPPSQRLSIDGLTVNDDSVLDSLGKDAWYFM